MAQVVALPVRGGLFLDARGADRALRVTWHHEAAIVVLSLWRGDTCAGTFRLQHADVAQLVHALVTGLSEAYPPAQRGVADAS